jgi:hypothetical protein
MRQEVGRRVKLEFGPATGPPAARFAEIAAAAFRLPIGSPSGAVGVIGKCLKGHWPVKEKTAFAGRLAADSSEN